MLYFEEKIIDMSVENLREGIPLTPTEETRLKIIEWSKLKTISGKPAETEKMHQCEHKKLKLLGGLPSHILKCCDCGYWQFFG